MNSPRYLNLLKIKLPIAGISSITHRISAVGVFLLSFPLLALLAFSLSSEENFLLMASMQSYLISKIILSLFIAGITYHFISGIRHLVMDFGYWETLKAGRNSAIGTFILSLLMSLIFIIQIW